MILIISKYYFINIKYNLLSYGLPLKNQVLLLCRETLKAIEFYNQNFHQNATPILPMLSIYHLLVACNVWQCDGKLIMLKSICTDIKKYISQLDLDIFVPIFRYMKTDQACSFIHSIHVII